MKLNLSLDGLLSSLTRPHPARDWFLLLSLFFILLVASLAYGAYLFIGIHEGTISGSAESAPAALPSVSKTDVSTLVQIFRSRKTAYDARSFPRPSLSSSAPAAPAK